MECSNNKISVGKIVFTTLFFLASCNCLWAQDKDPQDEVKTEVESDLVKKSAIPKGEKLPKDLDSKKLVKDESEPKIEIEDLEAAFLIESRETELKISEKIEFDKNTLREELGKSYIKEKPFFKPSDNPPIEYEPIKHFQKSEKFHWKPAIVESLYFLGIQHSLRTIQKKTHREFKGEFINDWGRSVKNLGGWRDGDSFFTNYIAHPMQGAVTGRIFINNSDLINELSRYCLFNS